MASIATVLQDTPGAVVVRVVHLDTDSFSRSVDRAANKAWRASRNARTATYVKGDYAFMDTDTARECVSIVAYATSFAAAQALVDSHVSILTCDGEHEHCEHCGELACTNGTDTCDLPKADVIMTHRQTLETPAEYEGVCSACYSDPEDDADRLYEEWKEDRYV